MLGLSSLLPLIYLVWRLLKHSLAWEEAAAFWFLQDCWKVSGKEVPDEEVTSFSSCLMATLWARLMAFPLAPHSCELEQRLAVFVCFEYRILSVLEKK